MSCDVVKATEGLENELWRGWSDGMVAEWAELIDIEIKRYTAELILQPFPSLHLCHKSFSNPSVALPTSQLILQPFRCFTCVTTHSPILPSLYLRHSTFSNPFVASLTSQFILQPCFSFCYVTSSSLNSPGEPPMAVQQTFIHFYGIIFLPSSFYFHTLCMGGSTGDVSEEPVT